MPAGSPLRHALFPDDHFFNEGFTIDFESVEVNAGDDLLSGLRVLSIPVRFVCTASQQQTFQRLASSDIPHTALQNWYSHLLREQVVDPQTDAMLTARIGAT